VKLFSFFFSKKITSVNSLINGKIEVIEQFGKRSIRVEGLEQSGPMVEKIWKKGIKQLSNYPIIQLSNCLVLGLGGGSVVKVVNKHFPKARISAIEIDPMMIKLGKKYLGLSEYKNLEIKITDAFKWLQGKELSGLNHLTKFDLILVDLYVGRKTPRDLQSLVFLERIKSLLSQNGIVTFNFLRTKEEKLEFQEFLEKLKKVYSNIKIVKPVANYLIICQ